MGWGRRTWASPLGPWMLCTSKAPGNKRSLDGNSRSARFRYPPEDVKYLLFGSNINPNIHPAREHAPLQWHAPASNPVPDEPISF